jgi:hypothetical protein
MSEYINAELRRRVVARAERLCEYCLIHEDDTFFGCEVDHIISLKHGGPTTADNLAYACAFCNLHKGSDLGSVFWATGALVRFFNPRTDHWAEHFELNGVMIAPLTPIGEVTARIFGFNSSDRVLERQTLMAVGRYPTEGARDRMKA